MPTPIDPKRLPGLKKALAGYADGEWASQKQLADLYGVAPSRFTTLVKTRFPDFPDHDRRGDKTHWYPARAAIGSMIRYMEDQARGKANQAARHTAVMTGVKVAQDEATIAATAEPPPLTATELDKLFSAQTKEFRLRQLQGQYVLRSEVERDTRAVLQMLSREVMNIQNSIDPNGELPAAHRDRLKNKGREMLTKMADSLAAYLKEDDGVSSGSTGSGSIATRDFQRRGARPGAKPVAGAA